VLAAETRRNGSPKVELIYDMDCPNVEHARQALMAAFGEAKRDPSWVEWDRQSPESLAYVRGYGSPTILVDGRDVASADTGDGADCCRVYDWGVEGLKGVPAVQNIVAALRGHGEAVVHIGNDATVTEKQRVRAAKSGWLGSVSSILAAAVDLVCPAYLPAFASLLASLGIGLAASDHFIRPLLIALLVVAVAAFAWSAKWHRHWWVVASGIAGGGLVHLGRYYLGFGALWMNQIALWAGTGVLIGTSVVNLWLKRSCPGCSTSPAKPDAGNSCCCNLSQTKHEER